MLLNRNNTKVEMLVGQVEKYENEIAEGAENVWDLDDLKSKNIRLQTTVDVYGAPVCKE